MIPTFQSHPSRFPIHISNTHTWMDTSMRTKPPPRKIFSPQCTLLTLAIINSNRGTTLESRGHLSISLINWHKVLLVCRLPNLLDNLVQLYSIATREQVAPIRRGGDFRRSKLGILEVTIFVCDKSGGIVAKELIYESTGVAVESGDWWGTE